MTFWQDARPATRRFRRPRPPRSSRRWSRRKRRGALVLVAAVVATVGVSVVRAGGETASPAAVVVRRGSSRGEPGRPRTIPARWARTLPDEAGTMLAGHDDAAIVIADHSVSSVTIADGSLRWRTPLADVETHGAVHGDTVLLSTRSGFVALDRETGKVRWRTETPETPGPVALVGPAGTPQIAVVSTDEGGLVGLDSATGLARWSVRLPDRPRGVMAVDDASGTLATVWQHDATVSPLRVIDGATGVVRWEQPLPVMTSSPVISNGTVVVGAGAGRDDSDAYAFALADGKPRWKTRVAAPFQEDLVPLVDGDDVFVVDELGHVSRLGVAHGTRRWATDTRALEVSLQPIRVDDAILVWNEAREVVTLDRATGAIRARRRPAGLPVGLVAGGRLVVLAQRLADHDTIQAFAADRLVAPARRGR